MAIVRPAAGTQPGWKSIPWHGSEALMLAAGPWLVMREPIDADTTEQTIALVNFSTGRIHGRWIWPRDAKVQVRHHGTTWLAFDDQGRVSAVSTATSEVRGVSVR
jgi:hypothetical protein